MTEQAVLPLPIPGLEPAAITYVTGEEAIQVTVFNAAAAVTVSLTGRFIPVRTRPDDSDPRVQSFRHDIVPTTNRVASTRTEVLGEGWLLDGAVQVIGGAPLIGQCYVIVALVRGKLGALQAETVLGQGYITANQRLPITGLRFESFLDGGGALRSIVGTVPGAGAEFTETVPTGARWEVLSFQATLVTAAAVANRVPILIVDDGVNLLWDFIVQGNETASATWTNVFAQGMPSLFTAANTTNVAPLPSGLQLGAGHRLRSLTTGLQAGDQYAAPKYLVRERIEGA